MSEEVIAPITNDVAIVRDRATTSVNSRAGDLLSRMTEAADAAAETDDGDVVAEPVADDDAPVTKPDAKTKRPNRIEELEQKAVAERARLKSRRAVLSEKEQLAQARAQMQQQMDRIHAQNAELERRLKMLDPDDPDVLRRVLDKVGGEEIGKFILDDLDPEKRAAREARNQKPKTQEAASEVAELRAQLNEFIGAKRRADNEAEFRSRVTALSHDEEGGAPLAGSLMKDEPKEFMSLAYTIANQWVANGKVFDDDDLIEEIESKLSRYASILGGKKQPQKQAAVTAKRTVTEQAEDDDADAPADEPAVATKTRMIGKTDSKSAFAQRVMASKRVVAALDRKR